MKRLLLLAILSLTLAACGKGNSASIPPAQALTADAIAHYCGMNVLEHPGPKGQIILASRIDPIWFSTARDTIAFTLLPEEPKDIQVVYVSDMAKAKTWDNPGPNDWVDAKKAWFVIGSLKRSGMGAEETVPFSTPEAAEDFAKRNGGRVVAFSDIPHDYVLGGTTTGATTEPRR